MYDFASGVQGVMLTFSNQDRLAELVGPRGVSHVPGLASGVASGESQRFQHDERLILRTGVNTLQLVVLMGLAAGVGGLGAGATHSCCTKSGTMSCPSQNR